MTTSTYFVSTKIQANRMDGPCCFLRLKISHYIWRWVYKLKLRISRVLQDHAGKAGLYELPGTIRIRSSSWWRHQMEIFSALLAIRAGNSPVTGEFPTQRPGTRSFDVYFDLRTKERLSKQWWGWWFETLSRSLWRHRNDCTSTCLATVLSYQNDPFNSYGLTLIPSWTSKYIHYRAGDEITVQPFKFENG